MPQEIVSYSNVLALVPAHRENSHRDTPVAPEYLQRDAGEIVQAMTPARFAPGQAEIERDRLNDALRFMRQSDVYRVMAFTDITPPFGPRAKARNTK